LLFSRVMRERPFTGPTPESLKAFSRGQVSLDLLTVAFR
jgi:hypothetical protein